MSIVVGVLVGVGSIVVVEVGGVVVVVVGGAEVSIVVVVSVAVASAVIVVAVVVVVVVVVVSVVVVSAVGVVGTVRVSIVEVVVVMMTQQGSVVVGRQHEHLDWHQGDLLVGTVFVGLTVGVGVAVSMADGSLGVSASQLEVGRWGWVVAGVATVGVQAVASVQGGSDGVRVVGAVWSVGAHRGGVAAGPVASAATVVCHGVSVAAVVGAVAVAVAISVTIAKSVAVVPVTAGLGERDGAHDNQTDACDDLDVSYARLVAHSTTCRSMNVI